jgi:hypothetical protein
MLLGPGPGSAAPMPGMPRRGGAGTFAHPLHTLAGELEPLTCAQLRALTGTCRRCSKAQLIGAALAC